ncbi:MAG: hypothetical protein KF881_14450 [Acidobacteria bacterium]|jgi:hypothetical protein|nr:hypothetical protein [Acidobacteriota bacterium]
MNKGFVGDAEVLHFVIAEKDFGFAPIGASLTDLENEKGAVCTALFAF